MILKNLPGSRGFDITGIRADRNLYMTLVSLIKEVEKRQVRPNFQGERSIALLFNMQRKLKILYLYKTTFHVPANGMYVVFI